ncbi:hypothetical protein [Robiginitalea marina]|nr:hypothetical protein [Robiginitalea marina]
MGAGGRRFESCHPDETNPDGIAVGVFSFLEEWKLASKFRKE